MTARLLELNQQLTQQFLAVYPEEREFVEDINRGGEVVFANYVSEVHAYCINSPASEWDSQRVAEIFRRSPPLLFTGRHLPLAETVQHINRILRHPGMVGLFGKIIQSTNLRQPSAGLSDFDHHAVDYLALRSGIKAIDLIEDGRRTKQGVAHRLPYYVAPRSASSNSDYAFMDLASGTNFEDYLPDILESGSQRPIMLVDTSPYVSRFWSTLSQALRLRHLEVVALDVRQLSRPSMSKRVGTVRLQNVAPWVRDLSEEWVEKLFDLVEPGGQITLVQPTGQLLADNPGRPEQVGVEAFVQAVMKQDEHNAQLIRNFARVLSKRREDWEFLYGHVGESGRLYEAQAGYARFRDGALPKIYDSLIIFQKSARRAGLEEPGAAGDEEQPVPSVPGALSGAVFLNRDAYWTLPALRQVIQRHVVPHLPTHGTVLEVGAGRRGRLRALIGEQLSPGVTWIETDRRVERLPTARPFETQRQIATLPALLEIPDGSVDAVIGLSVLDAIPQSQLPAALAAMARVLRPGGQVLQILDLALSYEAEADKVAGQSLIPWMYCTDTPDRPSARRIVYVDRIALTQVVNEAMRGQKITGGAIRTFQRLLENPQILSGMSTVEALVLKEQLGSRKVLRQDRDLTELMQARFMGAAKHAKLIVDRCGPAPTEEVVVPRSSLQDLPEDVGQVRSHYGSVTLSPTTQPGETVLVSSTPLLFVAHKPPPIPADLVSPAPRAGLEETPLKNLGSRMQYHPDAGTLLIDGQPVERLGQGGNNWIFGFGDIALRLSHRSGAELGIEAALPGFALLADGGIGPRELGRGFTLDDPSDGYQWLAVERIYGYSLDTGKAWNAQELGHLNTLFARLLDTRIYVSDCKPSNFMIGHRAGEMTDRDWVIDAEVVSKNLQMNRAELAARYTQQLTTVPWIAPAISSYDPRGAIVAYLQQQAGAPIPVLVETDRDHAEFIREALGSGFLVVDDPRIFTDGVGPRVVIVDAPAPDLSRTIRSRWPTAKLIAITGGVADAVLSKPLDWEQLKQTVYTQLGLAPPESSATARAVSDDLAAGLESREALGTGT